MDQIDEKNDQTVLRKRKRRPQVERSSEMKRRLLDAAFEVLKEQGFAAFAAAEVAKRAGVSRGAMVHHFPSKTALVEAAMEHVFKEALGASVKIAQSIKEEGDPVEGIIRDASAYYFSDYFNVALDMAISAEKIPEFRGTARLLIRNYRVKAEEEWVRVLVGFGFPKDKADDIVWMTVSLMRGAAIRSLWRNEPAKIRHAMGIWRGMVRDYLGPLQPASETSRKGRGA